MLYYYRRNYFGGRDLDQFGYLQGIRTQSIFIREQARDIEKITFQVFWMTRADGAILRMRWQVWLKNTSKFYLLLLLRLIWILFWTQLIEWLLLIWTKMLQPYTPDEVKRALFHMHPFRITWARWYVSILFPKILAHCRQWCHKCCFINSTFWPYVEENEPYTYSSNP